MKAILFFVLACTIQLNSFSQKNDETVRKIDSITAITDKESAYQKKKDSVFTFLTNDSVRLIKNVDDYFIDAESGLLKKINRTSIVNNESYSEKPDGNLHDTTSFVYDESVFFRTIPTTRILSYYYNDNKLIKTTETRFAGDTVVLSGTYYFNVDGDIIRAREKRKRQSVAGSIHRDSLFINAAAMFLNRYKELM